jgi:hypothetical protein
LFHWLRALFVTLKQPPTQLNRPRACAAKGEISPDQLISQVPNFERNWLLHCERHLGDKANCFRATSRRTSDRLFLLQPSSPYTIRITPRMEAYTKSRSKVNRWGKVGLPRDQSSRTVSSHTRTHTRTTNRVRERESKQCSKVMSRFSKKVTPRHYICARTMPSYILLLAATKK